MFNIFLTVFFSTLAFAFLEPFFFIGYLVSIALFGLYQAIFMANAGGAWDNAKKIVEVELKEKGTPLHAATVVGDTVGDPFKDTSSVAMNPVIKFTTLFGLLAVELAVQLTRGGRAGRELGALGGVLRRFGGLRLAVVLRDADPGGRGSTWTGRRREPWTDRAGGGQVGFDLAGGPPLQCADFGLAGAPRPSAGPTVSDHPISAFRCLSSQACQGRRFVDTLFSVWL